MDLGIYTLQIATLIFGGLPSNVVAAGHLNKEGVDEAMSCVLTYSSGATAVLSTHSKVLLPNTAVIVGTNGSIQVCSSNTVAHSRSPANQINRHVARRLNTSFPTSQKSIIWKAFCKQL